MALDVLDAKMQIEQMLKQKKDGKAIAKSLFSEGYTLAIAATALKQIGFWVGIIPVESTFNILMISSIIPEKVSDGITIQSVCWVPKEGHSHRKAPELVGVSEVFENPTFGLPCVDVMFEKRLIRELIIRWIQKNPGGENDTGYAPFWRGSDYFLMKIDMSNIKSVT